MIAEATAALGLLTLAAAWLVELRAHRRAAQQLAERALEIDILHQSNRGLRETLKREQIEIEVLKESEDYVVVGHLESTVQVTDYNGLPIYRWELTSPYPTLAEAVRHVPKSR